MKKPCILILVFIMSVACTKKELPIACFEYEYSDSSAMGFQTINCSENATSFLWLFDRTIEVADSINSLKNPFIQTDLNNPLNIALVAQNEWGSDTIAYSISAGDFGLEPEADFSFAPTFDADLKVEFSNQSLFANRFSWDFGDGKTSDEDNPTHQYETEGVYEVELIAFQEDKTNSTSKQIVVADTLSLKTPSMYFKINENKTMEVHFFGAAKNARTFLWKFGDGSTSREKSPVHVYDNYGTYIVSLEVSNSSGTLENAWEVRVPDPQFAVEACFDFTFDAENPNKVYFSNCSKNATTYNWDFDGAEGSQEENPVIVFPFDVQDENPGVQLTACNEYGECDYELQCLAGECVLVGKPNVYLYPETTLQLDFSIDFPMGGTITESFPEYGDGWEIIVEPNGLIDKQYTYLYYESIQPEKFQSEKGWCVAQDDLTDFFKSNLAQYQFNENEINDFIKYWIPRLNTNPHYNIYPQTKEQLDEIISFSFSVQPDNIMRLVYLIEGQNTAVQLSAPLIPEFQRKGFVVMEWGVSLW